MLNSSLATTAQLSGSSAFLSEILSSCFEISEVWSLDLCPRDAAAAGRCEWLAFADAATLRRLRKLEDLHRADVELLVVIDGDAFESAWGPRHVSGSLARWGWQRISHREAYYDESRWMEGGGSPGAIVRVRRKALLLWGTTTGAFA